MHGEENAEGDAAEKRLERLIEEFTARIRSGESPSTEEYVERYPDLADRLRNTLPAILIVEKARGPGNPRFR